MKRDPPLIVNSIYEYLCEHPLASVREIATNQQIQWRTAKKYLELLAEIGKKPQIFKMKIGNRVFFVPSSLKCIRAFDREAYDLTLFIIKLAVAFSYLKKVSKENPTLVKIVKSKIISLIIEFSEWLKDHEHLMLHVPAWAKYSVEFHHHLHSLLDSWTNEFFDILLRGYEQSTAEKFQTRITDFIENYEFIVTKQILRLIYRTHGMRRQPTDEEIKIATEKRNILLKSPVEISELTIQEISKEEYYKIIQHVASQVFKKRVRIEINGAERFEEDAITRVILNSERERRLEEFKGFFVVAYINDKPIAIFTGQFAVPLAGKNQKPWFIITGPMILKTAEYCSRDKLAGILWKLYEKAVEILMEKYGIDQSRFLILFDEKIRRVVKDIKVKKEWRQS